MAVRLLLDQNLPRRAVKVFETLGIEAIHVHSVGLANQSDRKIWRYASQNQLVIVTKDADFTQIQDLTVRIPVRVVWLRVGNLTNMALFPWILTHWPRAQELLDQGHTMIELR
jgi:predicted nuclease of predicted toxin-antitoxin system